MREASEKEAFQADISRRRGLVGLNKHQDSGFPRHRFIGLIAGPLAAAAIAISPTPDGLSLQGWWTAAVALWMAIWWMTEALPLAATAMLPVLLFPMFDIRSIEDTTPSYAHPLIFLFLGGFLLARAMHVWGLDRRLALNVLRYAGTRPRRVIAGIMAVTAFLSMWVSNTATAMVMLPIGLSVVASYSENQGKSADTIAPAFLLGIAYAATIGGMGTIIGTPPNALFAAFMAETYGIEISFIRWMMIGVPLVLVMLPLTWFVLVRLVFPVGGEEAGQSVVQIGERLEELPRISKGERCVAGIMLSVAILWITRPFIASAMPWLHLSDAGIAVVGALLLFVLPVDLRRGRFLLTWEEAAAIRWDVLILFGGGLALAGAMGESGLAGWIGDQLSGLQSLPFFALLLAIGVLMVFVGELASNTAMAAVFLPVAGATAINMGEPVSLFVLPVALFATLGFMLPVATPPNAIVFGSGKVEIRHMLRAGLILDVIGIAIVAIAVLTLGKWVLPSG
jgi:solute carrier family 13 (sodium-dependent dicarboxylate transporter), member 2/3/5